MVFKTVASTSKSIVDVSDGNSYEIRYIRQQATPATPTGNNPSGWITSIPTSGYGNVWFTECIKDGSGNLVGSWSIPGLYEAYDSNLLSNQKWTVGTGAVGNYSINGTASENVREILDNPFGSKDIVWRAIDQDVASDPEGGWNHSNIPVDHTKMYRVSAWAKQLSSAGDIYLGCGGNNSNNMNGTVNNNPYFLGGINLPSLNKWYLLVGYIYSSGATETTDHPLGGVYDGVTGLKVASGYSFKNVSGITTQSHRAYQYYSTVVGTETQFYAPRFDLCDGKEPSIADLLKTGTKGSDGSNGKGVASIVEEYYLSTSSTTQTGGSWSTTVPTWVDGKFMWTRSTITYTDSSTATTTPVCVTGGKGSTGNAGKGIVSVDVQYYLSTSSTTQTGGSWSTTAPTWVDGKYMWSKTVTTYTDSTTSESTPVCITGAKGSTGSSGVGVTSIVEQYYLSTSSTTQTGGSWSTTVPTWVDGKFMWTRSVITYTDSTTTTTTPMCVTGGTGATGSTGKGITSVDVEYYLSTSNTTQTGGAWSTTAPTWVDGKYMWSRTKTVYTDATTVYSNPACITGAKGDTGGTGSDGKGINSITEYYLATSVSSGVTTATAGWTTTIQTITSTNKYLWNYEKVTYTDSTTSNTTPVVIGVYGDTGGTGPAGKGISSVTERYLATSASSGVTTATSGWTTTIQTITSTNKYLWNYETITYTDSTTSATTPVIIGVYGDTGGTGPSGKGVSSIVEQYYMSTSSTTQSGGSWSTTVPAWVDGNFMWTRSVITYTDSTSVTTNPVCVTGAKGGIGATGKGVTDVDVQYYLSTSSTTQTGGSWNTTAPTWVDGKYMWSKTVVTYTDSSTTESTPVCITGAKGSTGDTGTRGPESDESVYFGTNSSFYDWTGVLPVGYSGQTGVAPTKVASDNKTSGNAVQWTVTGGAGTYMLKSVTNRPYYQYIHVEATFKLTSGTIDGAGVLLRIEANADNDIKIHFKDLVASPVLNQWYTVSKIIALSATAPAGFIGYTIFPMAGWGSFGTVTDKTIQFDSVKIRPSTEGEVYGQNIGGIVDSWKYDNAGTIEIDGGKLKANSVIANRIAVGDFTNYVDDPTFKLGSVTYSAPFSVNNIISRTTGGTSLKLSATTVDWANCKLSSTTFPVKNGDKFFAEFWAYRDSANQPVNINIAVQGHDGVWDNDSDGNPTTLITATNFTWVKYSSLITVTKDGMATIYFKMPTNLDMTGNWYLADPVVRRAYTGEMIVDGSITAGKLNVTELSSIAANVGAGGLNINSTGSLRVTTTNKWGTNAAIQLQNSDITGLNGLYMKDVADNEGEGLLFLKNGKTAGDYSDSINDYWTLRVDGGGNLLLDGKVVFNGGDPQGKFLLDTAAFPNDGAVLTPSRTLSNCPNGWILVWSDFDAPSTGNNWNWYTSVIPKLVGDNGNQWSFDIPVGSSTGTYDNMASKSLTIYNDKIVGDVGNNVGLAADVVLRYVIAY